jgi:hypothetical protein
MLATAQAPAPAASEPLTSAARVPALALLQAAVDACLGLSEEPVPSDSDHDRYAVAEDLRLTRMLINRLELFFARRAGRWAMARASAGDIDGNPAGWIREECRMTSHAAVTALQVGAHEHELPNSIDAFIDGRIGLAHLGLLAETAEFAG